MDKMLVSLIKLVIYTFWYSSRYSYCLSIHLDDCIANGWYSAKKKKIFTPLDAFLFIIKVKADFYKEM